MTTPPKRRTFVERLGPRPTAAGFVARLRSRPADGGFVARLNANPADIYLVRGKDSTARPAWYYVRVRRGMQRAFETASKRGSVQLTEYGTILLSGYGQNPPSDVAARMFTEFGFSESGSS